MTKAATAYKSPLHQMTQTTSTCLWNDSASLLELGYSIDHGAVGATCNPVIVVEVLKKEMHLWKDRIQELIRSMPTATEHDIAWKVVDEISIKGAELLKPIFDDLLTLGRPNKPPRPWLGLYATAIEDKLVIVGLAKDGPAQKADLRTGDVLLSVAGGQVRELAGLYRKVWSLGAAGIEIPITIYRDGKTIETRIKSGDRTRFLKAPKLH